MCWRPNKTSHSPVQPGNFYCSWGVEWKSLRRLTFRWMRHALPLVMAVLSVFLTELITTVASQASENVELYSRVKTLLGRSVVAVAIPMNPN